MDWVKQKTGYYRDVKVATLSDPAEVMFMRGNALAGEIEESGFIPDVLIPSLSRRPQHAKRVANELVKAGLWERVSGGYRVVNFARINAELERLVERKKRDAERKRNARRGTASGGTSADASTDTVADCHADSLYDIEKEKEEDSAAAAAEARTPPPLELTPAVEILRAALEAHKLVVRWDRLTVDQMTEIEQLIDTHGDTALVKDAIRQYQPNKPIAYAQGWLSSWRQLRKPGHLSVVKPDPCTLPGHQGTTTHCAQCASERKAAR